jgi:hypothetical protein
MSFRVLRLLSLLYGCSKFHAGWRLSHNKVGVAWWQSSSKVYSSRPYGSQTAHPNSRLKSLNNLWLWFTNPYHTHRLVFSALLGNVFHKRTFLCSRTGPRRLAAISHQPPTFLTPPTQATRLVCPVVPCDITQGRTQHKTMLPTVLLLLHEVTAID